MQPSRTKQRLTSTIVGGAIWLCCLVPAALGHPIKVTRGTAVVTNETVMMELRISAEDLLHEPYLIPNEAGKYELDEIRRSAQTRGQAIRRCIVVRDDHGQEIDGELESWHLSWAGGATLGFNELRQLTVRYALRFPLKRSLAYLSFQQDVSRAAHANSTMILLAVRVGDEARRAIRLTSGGNVEIVRLARESHVEAANVWSRAEAASRRIRQFVQSDSHRTVRAIVQMHDAGVRVSLFIPMGILETWMPVARSRVDFLTAEEQDKSEQQIRAFISGQNRVLIEGQVVEGTLTDVEFLDIGDIGGSLEGAGRRLGFWTTRALIRLEYDSNRHPQSVDLKWTLFNSAVLAGHVLIVADGECLEHDVSRYDPNLNWTAD